MQRYRVDGGAYWQWVNNNDSDEHNPQLAEPVKRRGTAFVYNPVWLQLLDMYGFHLSSIPNGSFEQAGSAKRHPRVWMIDGKGTVALVPFARRASPPMAGTPVLTPRHAVAQLGDQLGDPSQPEYDLDNDRRLSQPRPSALSGILGFPCHRSA